MNRSHRIIWNETRKAFVVAAEGAKAKGKPSSTRKAMTVAVLGTLGALAAMPALAATSCQGGGSLVTISGAETSACQLNAGDSLNVTNTGSITTSNYGVLAQSSGVVGSITSSGTISGAISGIYLIGGGSVSGSITNSSSISGGTYGINIAGGSSVGSITNNAGGTISGGVLGIFVVSNSNVGSISNSGSISGGTSAGIAIGSGSSVGSITNSGSISGGRAGILAFGSTVSGSLTNSGSISGSYGIDIKLGSRLGSLTNSGTISGGVIGINLYLGTISGSLTNSGSISGGSYGIVVGSRSSVGTITNSGSISGGSYGIVVDSGSSVGTITNSGSISSGSKGIFLIQSTVGSLTNSGSISSNADGIAIGNGSVGSLSNSGSISGGSVGILVSAGTVSGSITNSGSISSSGAGISIVSNSSVSSVGSLTNSGSISGGAIGIFVGGSTISGGFSNSGTISGASIGISIVSASSVGSLTNSGTISGGGPFAVFVSGNSTLPTINITGNNTARFIGDVYAQNTAVTVDAHSTFTNDNAFNVQSFTIANTGIFNMGAGTTTSTFTANGVNTSAGFTNHGTLNVADGVTAHITGDYTQALDGIFQTTASSATSYGKLVVSGTATLVAGTGIKVNVASVNTLAAGNILSGVISAGTLSASTFNVSEFGGSGLFNFSAVVNGNAVDLLTTAASNSGVHNSVVSSGFTPGLGAATVLDGFVNGGITGKDTDNVVTALGKVAKSQLSNAVGQTLPLMTGSMMESTKSTLTSINRVIESRQDANRGLSSGDDFYGDKQVWIKPLGAWTNQDDRKGVTGYSANTYGLVGGIDGEISDTTRVGVALAYAHTNVDSNSSAAPQSADVDNYQAILYGSHSLDERSTLSLQGNLGTSTTKGDRTINFGGLNRVANSNYDSWSGHIGAGLSRSYAINPQTTLTPGIRIDYTKLHSQGYTETGTGGALNMNVGSSNAEELILLAESRAAYQVTDHGTFIGNLGLGYDALASRNSITAAYTGGGASFITQGIDPSPFLMRGGAGYVMTNSNAIEVTARLDFEVREHFDNETASVKVKVPF